MATLIVSLVLVVFVLLVVARTVRIVPQARAGVVERFGRYQRTLTPGLSLVVPFVDRLRPLLDLRERVVSFPPQPVITDNLVVNIDTVIGLEQERCERPDLILTDVAMLALDGFRLAERLRQEQRTRGIPLIFLSGEVGAAHAERARTLGALAYLTKPFDPGALATFVAHELTAARVRPADLTATVATSAVA